MKRALVPTIVYIFVLALVAGVSAGPTQTERPHLAGKRFIGTVVSADNATKILLVRSWKGETVFDTATAQFARHGRLEDMEPGERVLIRYVEEDGKKVARFVIKAAFKYSNEKRNISNVQIGKPANIPENH
jgi:hypothetical protein